jgi:integrase
MLQFLLLNPVRIGQIAGLTLDQIDQDNLWTCPPEKHKAGHKTRKPYILSLSSASVEILHIMRARNIDSPFVFAQGRTEKFFGKPLTSACCLKHLRRISGRSILTQHGARTSFSSWAYEQNRYTPLAIEAALGHGLGSAIAKRYNYQAQLREPVRELLHDWARYLLPTANVIPIAAHKRSA